MRRMRHVVTAAVAMGLFAATVLFVGPAAMAVGPDTDQMIRDGKVIDNDGNHRPDQGVGRDVHVSVELYWAAGVGGSQDPTGRQRAIHRVEPLGNRL